MTVTTSTARVVHKGNGTTIEFAVPFRFLQNSHVAVFLRDASGGQVLWTENTEYSLAGADLDAGGTLTVITSPTDYTPASGEKLVVVRAVPITQETDYVENDPFPADTHERALDKLTMINQEQTERLDRTFTIPETDNLAGSFVLPGDVDRAGMFLAFDANGNPIASIGTAAGQEVPFSDFGKDWVSSVDAASARTTLDAPALSAANYFTADQEISSADAGAAGGPNLTLIRRSTSPAASDALGQVRLQGRNDAGEDILYAFMTPLIVDPADGSEDGQLTWGTMRGGGSATRMALADGLSVGNPLPEDKGNGAIHGNSLYANDVQVRGDELFHVRDEKASVTGGGTFTAGSWQTRDLNTVKTNEITGASLSSNQIILPAGTYEVDASAPASGINGHQARLRNVTDGADLALGRNARAPAGQATMTDSIVRGRFTLAGTKTIELQHRCQATSATTGFGHAHGFGPEVYSEVQIRKLA